MKCSVILNFTAIQQLFKRYQLRDMPLIVSKKIFFKAIASLCPCRFTIQMYWIFQALFLKVNQIMKCSVILNFNAIQQTFQEISRSRTFQVAILENTFFKWVSIYVKNITKLIR